jgi:hypothetical protein
MPGSTTSNAERQQLDEEDLVDLVGRALLSRDVLERQDRDLLQRPQVGIRMDVPRRRRRAAGNQQKARNGEEFVIHVSSSFHRPRMSDAEQRVGLEVLRARGHDGAVCDVQRRLRIDLPPRRDGRRSERPSVYGSMSACSS